MWLTILIVVACLWAMTVWAGLILVRLKNRSSTPPSPTPSTTPTPTSDEVLLSVMKMAMESSSQQAKEMRDLVVDLTQGRASQTQSGTPETSQMWSERPLDYDYDSTPLSPGIEAVIERENEETEQARIAREREELQGQIMEKQAELDRFDLEQSSNGPWNGNDPKHARTD